MNQYLCDEPLVDMYTGMLSRSIPLRFRVDYHRFDSGRVSVIVVSSRNQDVFYAAGICCGISSESIQSNAITLAHHYESGMQRFRRFGEASFQKT